MISSMSLRASWPLRAAAMTVRVSAGAVSRMASSSWRRWTSSRWLRTIGQFGWCRLVLASHVRVAAQRALRVWRRQAASGSSGTGPRPSLVMSCWARQRTMSAATSSQPWAPIGSAGRGPIRWWSQSGSVAVSWSTPMATYRSTARCRMGTSSTSEPSEMTVSVHACSCCLERGPGALQRVGGVGRQVTRCGGVEDHDLLPGQVALGGLAVGGRRTRRGPCRHGRRRR